MKSQNAHQRILVAHRYYWPDTPPYASILRSIAQQWTKDGHQVDVLSSQPSYKKNVSLEKRPARDQIDNSEVWRLNLPNEAGRPLIRLLNAVRFCLALFLRAVKGKYDVVMISTVPPVLGGLAAAIAAKVTGARFIYHCMDIHPEVGRVSGEFSNTVLFQILQKLDCWICRQANPVIVLSPDMEETLLNRPGGHSTQVQVLNNFSLPTSQAIPTSLPFSISDNVFTLLFAGNIGRFQGLETAIAAMEQLGDRSDIELIIMGDGVAKESLQQQAQNLEVNVRFVGHFPVEVAKAAMKKAGAGFVSLRAGLYQYVYPSKTLTYLEQGCPLLVAIEPESCLAHEVTKKNLGYSVPSGNAEALANAVRKLADDNDNLLKMRSSALETTKQECSSDVVLKKWSQLIASPEPNKID